MPWTKKKRNSTCDEYKNETETCAVKLQLPYETHIIERDWPISQTVIQAHMHTKQPPA